MRDQLGDPGDMIAIDHVFQKIQYSDSASSPPYGASGKELIIYKLVKKPTKQLHISVYLDWDGSLLTRKESLS